MSKTRQWATITAVVVLVILAGGYLLLVKSQKSKVADLQTQTQSVLQQNQILLTQISALQAEAKELPAQQQALAKFSTLIPDSADEPTLIRQLSNAARGAGIDLKSIAPSAGSAISTGAVAAPQALGGATGGGAAVAPVKLYAMSVSLSISGSYANVESFFQTLEKLPRALLIGSFSVTPSTDATGASAVSVTMSTKVFYTPTSVPTDDAGATAPESLTPSTPATAPTTGVTTAPGTAPTSATTTPASAT